MFDTQKLLWKPKIITDKIDERTSVFTLQYLPRGFWHTLWNSLRRAILGYDLGGAVTALKVKGVSHEYSTIDWVKETVIEIMLNFKKLRFKIDENVEKLQWISQRFKWIKKYTLEDLKLPSGITILNDECYLFEITDPSLELVIDVRIEKGYGYFTIDFLRRREEKEDSSDIGLFLIDNDFKSVEYVKYHVEEVLDDFSGTSKDRLVLEIKTISDKIDPKQVLTFAGEVVTSYTRLFVFDEAYIDRSVLLEFGDLEDSSDKFKNVEVKTVPIDALPLSERTRNALIKNEILYVEDLEKKRKNELLTMKWVWRKAVDEICQALESMWKSLAG